MLTTRSGWLALYALTAALISPAATAVPPDGTYTGNTGEGKAISITVSGGQITAYSIGWSCGGGSGTQQVNTACSITGANTFQCGSSSCTFTPFVPAIGIGGTFSGSTVSGTFDLSYYPCTFGCSCCFKNDVTYSAALPAPALSINDVAVAEGDAGTTAAVFEVTLSPAAAALVTVNWATADGTADASDYVPASGGLSFGVGQTSKMVTVQVSGDADPESDETFFVDLSGAVNANVADDRGQGTINDDDTPVLSTVMVLSGFDSMDALADPDNQVLSRELGEGAVMTGVGWNIHLTTVGASWRSEARLYFDGSDQDGMGLFLTPGAGDDSSGTGSYASPVIDLTDNGLTDIPILSDGRLYVQLFEGFDDNAGSPDANYDPPSSVTIQYRASPFHIFSDGFESGDVSLW